MPTEDEVEDGPVYDIESVLDAPDEYEISIQAEVFFWAVVDEYATDQQTQRLESIINRHEVARQTIAPFIQLHVDLIYYFHGKRSPEEADKSAPVLWPAVLEPVLINACPDREERKKVWLAGQHKFQQLADMLPSVDDLSGQLASEGGSFDINTVENRTTSIEADEFAVIRSLGPVDDRNKKSLLSKIMRMFGIR